VQNTWMNAVSQWFTAVPCAPTHLWRFHGTVFIQAENQSACSTKGLGSAATGLTMTCTKFPTTPPAKSDFLNYTSPKTMGPMPNATTNAKTDDDTPWDGWHRWVVNVIFPSIGFGFVPAPFNIEICLPIVVPAIL
jgi:hypothetical protein